MSMKCFNLPYFSSGIEKKWCSPRGIIECHTILGFVGITVHKQYRHWVNFQLIQLIRTVAEFNIEFTTFLMAYEYQIECSWNQFLFINEDSASIWRNICTPSNSFVRFWIRSQLHANLPIFTFVNVAAPKTSQVSVHFTIDIQMNRFGNNLPDASYSLFNNIPPKTCVIAYACASVWWFDELLIWLG